MSNLDVLSVWWPRPGKPHYLWAVPHPSADVSFCNFPEIRKQGLSFEAAPVYLLFGKHFGKHRGFGCVHILEEHWRELGLKSKEPSPDVVAYIAKRVAEICKKGAKINCEFENAKGDHKPLVVQGSKGVVVLQQMFCHDTRQTYYSVVTIMVFGKAKGSLIGSL